MSNSPIEDTAVHARSFIMSLTPDMLARLKSDLRAAAQPESIRKAYPHLPPGPRAESALLVATVMNAISMQAAVESHGVPTRVMTAFAMPEVAEPYVRRRAIRHLEKGRVVIFGAGTGNPFFTTDTGAALRAAEINAQCVLKATMVDGVYDSDPKRDPAAKLYESLTYETVQRLGLGVMDLTAITLCQENDIPVVVFNLNKQGNIASALRGNKVGTCVSSDVEKFERADEELPQKEGV